MTDQALTDEWQGPSDKTAVAYLRARGFTLRPGGIWSFDIDKHIDEKDLRAMRFLHQEWDYCPTLYQDDNVPPRNRRH